MTNLDRTPDPLRDPRFGVGMAAEQGLYAGFDDDRDALASNKANPAPNLWFVFGPGLFLLLVVVLVVVF